MTRSSESGTSDGTVLTSGLRRVLLGVVIAGFALVAVQVIAIGKLQREIEHWAWVAEVDAARETLVGVARPALVENSVGTSGEILAAFDRLRQSVSKKTAGSHQSGSATAFAELESEARTLFLLSEERYRALLPHQRKVADAIDELQKTAGLWSRQLRVEELGVLRRSELLDEQQLALAETRTSLTAAMLAVQTMQQQIISIDRLFGNASPAVVRSSVSSLDRSHLPKPCRTEDPETDGTICSPSIRRVSAALDRLQGADPDQYPVLVRQSLQALEGYIRAGQLRLQKLADIQKDTVRETGNVRAQLTDLRNLSESLSRIKRILLDFETKTQSGFSNENHLTSANRQIVFYISQLRIRTNGLMSIAPVLSGDTASLDETLSVMSDNWHEVGLLTAERLHYLNAFSATMEELSSEIAKYAEQVRTETTLWVSVYVSTFLVLAGFLAATVVGVFWLARNRFVQPLTRVTGTIIRLADGDLGRPFVMRERAFGFDELGSALEQLRLEMVESHALAERNREQQRIIEDSLVELERANKDMEWLAKYDPLTGLGNRRHVDIDLAQLTRSNASARLDFCVMQIDIDRFKSINDALGHAAGDFVLKGVADILVQASGAVAKCYRTGGDEFLVVFDHEISEQKASVVAQDIIDRIDQPMDYEGHRCRVGASIGIAFGRDADFDAMQAVINADLALYDVKQAGRDGYRFFSNDLASRSRRRKSISDRVLAAIEENAFTPFYQPQFHSGDLSLRGVEVLCRWNDAELGWISPGEFLPVADELGVIGRIDEVLFDKVALDLARLSSLGLSVPKISFNVAADRLLKTDLAQELCERIGVHSKIALELLESMSLDNPTESVVWAIDALRERGIEIEIDDFGSDRASLAGLMAIQPQAMKIDRAIVIPIVNSPRHQDLVKKIIDIGAALNIEVVAEGVETDQHITQLKLLGCGVLQGHGLARPMPFDDLITLCRTQSAGARRTGLGA